MCALVHSCEGVCCVCFCVCACVVCVCVCVCVCAAVEEFVASTLGQEKYWATAISWLMVTTITRLDSVC